MLDKDARYQQWITRVDWEIQAVCGLSHDDLADKTWRGWFEEGASPKEAAEMALEDEGFEGSRMDG